MEQESNLAEKGTRGVSSQSRIPSAAPIPAAGGATSGHSQAAPPHSPFCTSQYKTTNNL